MSTGPAADLARLRARHGQLWRIDRETGPVQETGSGPGITGQVRWIAIRRSNHLMLRDSTAAGLEAQITEQTGP